MNLKKMSEKEFDKFINDPFLLRFNWPQKMLSLAFGRKKYNHKAIIVSERNPDIEYELNFANAPDARAHVKSAKKAKNIIVSKYEKEEIKQFDGGFLL